MPKLDDGTGKQRRRRHGYGQLQDGAAEVMVASTRAAAWPSLHSVPTAYTLLFHCTPTVHSNRTTASIACSACNLLKHSIVIRPRYELLRNMVMI